jgi:hypothetical protein
VTPGWWLSHSSFVFVYGAQIGIDFKFFGVLTLIIAGHTGIGGGCGPGVVRIALIVDSKWTVVSVLAVAAD